MRFSTEGAATMLYNKRGHQCISFTTLVEGQGIQANQFLIVDQDHAALIDPGGDLTYTPLSIELSKRVDISQLDYIFASHQDPDIIASLPRWLMRSQCKVVTSQLWSRFLPHLASTFVTGNLSGDVTQRIIPIPDRGMSIQFGRSPIIALPAHFLHSVGNFQFYDPTSKILFSGDMGASLSDVDSNQPVEDFDQHIQSMQDFHQRYMCSSRVCKLWASMIRPLDVEIMVPQHGKPFVGKTMIHKFLNWISHLECGIDLLTEDDFRLAV
jgi:flavorubredoxin